MTRENRRPRHPMPDFVREALEGHGLVEAYEARPPYQRNDYLGWISRAKREDTRQRRLAQMLDELRRGDVYMKMPWGGGRKGSRTKRPPPELPDFVCEALEEHGLIAAYEARPQYQQQGYLRCIARPKREETRQRHLTQMLDELRRGDVYRKKPWSGGRKGSKQQPELADDVREALEDAGVLEAFLAQPPSHQRQHLRYIDEAKRPETRARRIAKTCERLRG